MLRVPHAVAGATGLITANVVVGRLLTGPLCNLSVGLRAAALPRQSTCTSPAGRGDRTGGDRRPTGDRER
ncbi:MAG: hypothetical protein QM695_04360 [Micropruina sp.]